MNVILIVSKTTSDNNILYTLPLLKKLTTDGFQPYIVASTKSDAAQFFKHENSTVKEIKTTGLAKIFAPVALASFINKLPDRTLILTDDFFGAQLASNARRLAKNPSKIKIISSFHNPHLHINPALATKTFSQIDAVVFDTPSIHKHFSPLLSQTNPQNIHILFPALQPQTAANNPAPKEIINILFDSDITHDCGLNTLIDALHDITHLDWHLHVFGTGKGRVVMPIVRKARAQGLSTRITWHGDSAEKSTAYSAADIFIASQSSHFTSATPLLHAFATETAIIAPDSEMYSELIENHKTGLLITPHDTAAMRETLKNVITSQSLRISLAQNSCENFHKKHNFDIFYNNFRKIIDINIDKI